MIKTDDLGNGYVRTYSDAGYYIHGGSPEGDYAEAVDLKAAGRTYTETTTKIEQDESDEYIEAAKILLGDKQ